MSARRTWEVGALLALAFTLALPAGLYWRRRMLDRELVRALTANDLSRIRRLVTSGATVDTRDHAGRTPLAVAAAGCDLPLVKLLLARGADVNARDAAGLTPLLGAAELTDAQTLEVLIEAGADVNVRDAQGYTALMQAVSYYGFEEYKAQRLLARGADVKAKAADGTTALSMARGFAPTAVPLLRARGATR